jgi:hypothetical protein
VGHVVDAHGLGVDRGVHERRTGPARCRPLAPRGGSPGLRRHSGAGSDDHRLASGSGGGKQMAQRPSSKPWMHSSAKWTLHHCGSDARGHRDHLSTLRPPASAAHKWKERRIGRSTRHGRIQRSAHAMVSPSAMALIRAASVGPVVRASS